MGLLGDIGSAVGGIASAISGHSANNANAALTRAQFEYQKELHRNQLQWRVEDAKKAGLHPMAALGLSSMSFSPVSSTMQGSDYSWMGDMGQALGAGYAAMKGKNKEEQEQAKILQAKSEALQLRNAELQNERLEAEIDAIRWDMAGSMSGAIGPALRGPGSPFTSGLNKSKYAIEGQPDSFITSGFEEPIKSYSIRLDADGKPAEIIPSDAYKSRVEDTMGVEWLPWVKSILLDRGAKDFGLNVGDFYWDSDKDRYVKGDGFWRRTGKVVRKKWKDFKSWLWR